MKFPKDNHFVDAPGLDLVDKERSNWLKRIISENYHQSVVDLSLPVYGVAGANINSGNYRIGNKFIKVIQYLDNEKDYVYNFSNIVSCLNFAGVQSKKFDKNLDSDGVSRCESEGENYFLLVQDFVEGSFFTGTIDELMSVLGLFEKLNLLNMEGSSLKNIHAPYKDWDLSSRLLELEPFIEIEKKQSLKELGQLVIRNGKEVTSALGNELDYLKGFDREVSHYDLHPHNFLFKDGKFVSLLDIESFVYTPKEIMLGFGIYKLCRKMLSKNIDLKAQVQETLKAYNFDYCKLEKYARIEVLRRALLVLELNYLKNDTRWLSDLPKHANGLKEIKYLFDFI